MLGDSAGDGRRHGRGPPAAAVVSLPAQRAGIPRRQPRPCPGTRSARTPSSASSPARTAPKCRCGWSPRPRAGCATPGVDRRARSCPGRRRPRCTRVSPLEASARYLRHLREAWDHQFKDAAARRAGGRPHRARVVRRRRARADARRPRSRPACRTSPCSRNRRPRSTPGSKPWASGLRKQVKPGDVILVVDVGGGTSDFSLIAVTEQGRRGATHAAWRSATTSCWAATTWTWRWPTPSTQQLAADGKKLDAWQFNAAHLRLPPGQGAAVRRAEAEEGARSSSRAAARRSSAARSRPS